MCKSIEQIGALQKKSDKLTSSVLQLPFRTLQWTAFTGGIAWYIITDL